MSSFSQELYNKFDSPSYNNTQTCTLADVTLIYMKQQILTSNFLKNTKYLV